MGFLRLGFFFAALVLLLSSAARGNGEWVEVVLGGKPYPIYVLQKTDQVSGKIVTYYTPPLLFVENPGRFGISYNLERERWDGEVKNVLRVHLVLDIHGLEKGIKEYFSSRGGSGAIHRIHANLMDIDLKIPGENRWVQSQPIQGVQQETYGKSGVFSFILDFDDTQRVLKAINNPGVEFKIYFGYASKGAVERLGSRIMRYVFPEELLFEIFGKSNDAYVTEWQLAQLWSQAIHEVRTQVFIEDDENLDEYLNRFADWASNLPREVTTGELRGFSQDWNSQYVGTRINAAEQSRLKKDHDLVIKAQENPGGLSSSEKVQYEKIKLVYLEKSDLTQLRKEALDLTSYHDSWSEFTVRRNSLEDRFRSSDLVRNLNSSYRAPLIRHKDREHSGKSHFITSDKQMNVRFLDGDRFEINTERGPGLRIPLGRSETLEAYEEAPEENALWLHVFDPTNQTSSTFAIDKNSGNLLYQHMTLPTLGIDVILEAHQIKVQESGNPSGVVMNYANLSQNDLLRFYFSSSSNSLLDVLYSNNEKVNFPIRRVK